jgi:hypothetical protein
MLVRIRPDVRNFTSAVSDLLTGLSSQYDVRRRSFEVDTYKSVD